MVLLLKFHLQHTSHLQTIFWFSSAIIFSPDIPRAAKLLTEDRSQLIFPLVLLSRWLVACISFCLQGVSNRSVLPPCTPEEQAASSLSLFTFDWFTPLVLRGWREPLLASH